MKSGGTGGASTQSGLLFEEDTDLEQAIENHPDFTVSNGRVHRRGRDIGWIGKKRALYKKFLGPKFDLYEEKIPLSNRLEPDNALYIEATKTLYIVEAKFQDGSGSVDEKLQTAYFKRRQYNRLLEGTGIWVEYYYVLGGKYFEDFAEKKSDVLDYIKESGSRYYFGEIPLNHLDLMS